jgi:hypothetical protein
MLPHGIRAASIRRSGRTVGETAAVATLSEKEQPVRLSTGIAAGEVVRETIPIGHPPIQGGLGDVAGREGRPHPSIGRECRLHAGATPRRSRGCGCRWLPPGNGGGWQGRER